MSWGSPAGTAENSPAIHCRGELAEAPSPVGTTGTSHCVSTSPVVPTGLNKKSCMSDPGNELPGHFHKSLRDNEGAIPQLVNAPTGGGYRKVFQFLILLFFNEILMTGNFGISKSARKGGDKNDAKRGLSFSGIQPADSADEKRARVKI